MTQVRGFICVHSIPNTVEHTIDEAYIRVRDIIYFSSCSLDHTKIGGVSSVHIIGGVMYLVTEPINEIALAVDAAERELVEK